MMLKKKVDGLEDYYYQWMNKYKDDADRRRELLRDIADWYEGKDYSMSDDLWKRVEEELADA